MYLVPLCLLILPILGMDWKEPLGVNCTPPEVLCVFNETVLEVLEVAVSSTVTKGWELRGPSPVLVVALEDCFLLDEHDEHSFSGDGE